MSVGIDGRVDGFWVLRLPMFMHTKLVLILLHSFDLFFWGKTIPLIGLNNWFGILGG